MKRTAGALVLAAALCGCVSMDRGPGASGPICRGSCGPSAGPPMIPGAQGPWGQGVPVAAPYHAPFNARAAQAMMRNSVPLDMVQMAGAAGAPSGVVQASANIPGGNVPGMAVPPGGLIAPPGVPLAPGAMPPAGPMMPQGGAPMMAAAPPAMGPGAGPMMPPGAMPAGPPNRFPVARTQVRFLRPSGMKIAWFTVGQDGKPSYSTTPIEAPGRYNFLQGAIYRLKLTNIEGRPGLELYPTLEVVPSNPHTDVFLAHSSVPVEFTNEDFQQVAEGNFVVKVIYLPHPQYQDLAGGGIDEIVSTRLEPGADPIKEALRRGSILLVIRMGNMDQEAPNTPPIDAPGAGRPPMPHGMHGGMGMGPGGMPPPLGPMVPYNPMMQMGPMGPMGPTGPMPGPSFGHPTGLPGMPMPGMPGMMPPGMPGPGTPGPAMPGMKGAAGQPKDAPPVGMPMAPALPPSKGDMSKRPEAGAVQPAGTVSLPLPGMQQLPMPAPEKGSGQR